MAGRACDPLTVRDEHSRYLLEMLRNARSQDGDGQRLSGSFTAARAARCDPERQRLALCHVSGARAAQLSAWWLALGIDLERGRPGCPQDNGAHERMHRDIGRELQAQRFGRGAGRFG